MHLVAVNNRKISPTQDVRNCDMELFWWIRELYWELYCKLYWELLGGGIQGLAKGGRGQSEKRGRGAMHRSASSQ
jgi:hypothetical protein